MPVEQEQEEGDSSMIDHSFDVTVHEPDRVSCHA